MNRLLRKLLKRFGWGFCADCGKLTNKIARFTDDPDDSYGYPDFCHLECYEDMVSKIR